MINALKRNVAVAVVALAVLGGGAIAFANGSPSRATLAGQAAGEQAPDGHSGTQPHHEGDKPAAEGDKPAAEGHKRPEGERDKARRHHEGRHHREGREHRRPGAGPLRPAIHGDLIVRNDQGGFEKVTFDRGILTEVKDGHLKLDRPDGHQVVVRLTDDTKYKGVDDASQLKTGRRVFVISKDGVATHVAQSEREDSEKSLGADD